MNRRKFLRRLLQSQTNVRFTDLVWMAEGMGFHLDRTRGSHHIFVHPGVPSPLNLQNVNGEAKPYQVKQFLKLVEEYNLILSEEE